MSIKLTFTKIVNHVFLSYELIIGNRRLIISTMIGFIIALTILSQSGFLIESYRHEILEETVFKQRDYYEDGDIKIEFWERLYRHPGEFNVATDFEYWNALTNRSINQVNYFNYISNYYWYSRVGNYIWLNRTDKYLNESMDTRYMPIFVSSATEFYSELKHFLSLTGNGRLPNNSSEIILIRPKNWLKQSYEEFENVTLGAKVNITLTSKWYSKGSNKTVKIVGIIGTTDSYPDNSTLLFSNYFRWVWDYCFLTQPIFLKQTIEELVHTRMESNVEIRGKIFLDSTQFDAYNVNNEMYKLEVFIRALKRQFQNQSSIINSWMLDEISDYRTTVFGLVIIMLLLTFPVLCIALYFVVYSFELIRKQKQKQIGILKTRGGSWVQILVILLGEMIITTILAVTIGLLLSFFLTDVVLRSTNYLEFLGSQVPVRITIGMVQALFFWGVFFTIILNFQRIVRMTQKEISETLETIETGKPLWKRYHLDIIITIIGITIWLILMDLIRSGNRVINPKSIYIYNLIYVLGIPAPFLVFFGTITAITRLFPFIMKKLANILWRLESGINAFSIRNIIRHKQASNRAVLLITLSLSFSILSSSLTFSIDETKRFKYYYRDGADISIHTGTSLNKSVFENLKQNVSHIKSISGVYTGKHYFNEFNQIYHFLFVDPSTYAKTAFINPSFKLSKSLSILMDLLTGEDTIILYEGNLKADVSKPRIGGNISLEFRNDTNSEYLSFRVGGTFKYWPNLYPYDWSDPTTHFWIIGGLDMFDRLQQSNYLRSIKAIYQAKIDSLCNIEETIEKITNVTGITPNSPALSYKEYKLDFERRFSLSILNSNLIICLAVVVIGIIMFVFFTYVERGKEIGVERALGMTQFQTIKSFLVEAAAILTFSLIIGYSTGVYFTTMFLQIMQFGETIPPMVVSYPTVLLLQMILGILITAGIGTIIPAYISTRKDISRILKVE